MTSVWIQYEDANGKGVACPDAIVLRTPPDLSLVIECKLTRSADGPVQLAQLYLPLVQAIWPDRRWALVHVFKNWAGSELAAHPIKSLSEAVELEVCDLYLPEPRRPGALQVGSPSRANNPDHRSLKLCRADHPLATSPTATQRGRNGAGTI